MKIEHATNKTSTCNNNKTIYMKYLNKSPTSYKNWSAERKMSQIITEHFKEVLGSQKMSTSLHTRLAAKMYLGDSVFTGNRKHGGPQITRKKSDIRYIQMRWATFQPEQMMVMNCE
jgi:hypothetical protein